MIDRAAIVQQRIDGLQKKAQEEQAGVRGGDWYELLVAPTCPPGRSLWLKGGRVFTGSASGVSADYHYRAYTLPSLEIDLTDVDQVTTDVTFETAGWYSPYVLLLTMPTEAEEPAAGEWTFWIFGDGEELETAAEAEQYMALQTMTYQGPWGWGFAFRGFPLCGLILQNNGTIGPGCQILPVDYVNRGRSYLWPPDIRPKRFLSMG